MKYDVYSQFTKQLVKKGVSKEDVDKFIDNQARDLNYGFLRYWTEDGVTYYDCGPIVYAVKVSQ